MSEFSQNYAKEQEYKKELRASRIIVDKKLAKIERALRLVHAIEAWTESPANVLKPCFEDAELDFLRSVLGDETACEVSRLYYFVHNRKREDY